MKFAYRYDVSTICPADVFHSNGEEFPVTHGECPVDWEL